MNRTMSLLLLSLIYYQYFVVLKRSKSAFEDHCLLKFNYHHNWKNDRSRIHCWKIDFSANIVCYLIVLLHILSNIYDNQLTNFVCLLPLSINYFLGFHFFQSSFFLIYFLQSKLLEIFILQKIVKNYCYFYQNLIYLHFVGDTKIIKILHI